MVVRVDVEEPAPVPEAADAAAAAVAAAPPPAADLRVRSTGATIITVPMISATVAAKICQKTVE